MLRLRHARHRGTALFAVLALLLAQAIGMAHAVAHPHAQRAALAAALHSECEEHAGQHHHGGLFDAHHDEGSLQCQLLDQLAHADGLTAPSADWTFAAPQAGFTAAPAVAVRATCACGYHARGPPPLLA